MDLKYKGIDNKPSLKRLVETLKKALEDSRVNPAKGYVRKHATDKEYIEAIRFQAEGHISALQTQHPELTLPQTANNLTALREIIAQGEKILDGKSVSTKQTTTPQTGNGGGDSKVKQREPLYKEINFAEHTVTIGDKVCQITSTRQWAALVELKDNRKDSTILPSNQWKTAIDKLRNKVGGPDNLRKIIQYTNGGYVFCPDVKLINIGQVRIRPTHQAPPR